LAGNRFVMRWLDCRGRGLGGGLVGHAIDRWVEWSPVGYCLVGAALAVVLAHYGLGNPFEDFSAGVMWLLLGLI